VPQCPRFPSVSLTTTKSPRPPGSLLAQSARSNVNVRKRPKVSFAVRIPPCLIPPKCWRGGDLLCAFSMPPISIVLVCSFLLLLVCIPYPLFVPKYLGIYILTTTTREHILCCGVARCVCVFHSFN
jgi:hypothetical protein